MDPWCNSDGTGSDDSGAICTCVEYCCDDGTDDGTDDTTDDTDVETRLY